MITEMQKSEPDLVTVNRYMALIFTAVTDLYTHVQSWTLSWVNPWLYNLPWVMSWHCTYRLTEI